MREIVEPTVNQHKSNGPFDVYEEHPAYGQIAVSRVSGGRYLYGSDFEHSNYVVVRISESQLNRTLNRDWPFARKEIIEVALTEAQWATFVSSFNQGSGVQCTIERREGVGMVPGFPAPNRADKFKIEVAEDLKSIIEQLTDLKKAFEENTTGLSKKAAATLLEKVNKALRVADDHVPFAQKQFEEHMEDVKEKTKAEVHGYLSHQINRLGLDAIGTKPEDILLLDNKKE